MLNDIDSADLMSTLSELSPMGASEHSYSSGDSPLVDVPMAQAVEQTATCTEVPLSVEGQVFSVLGSFVQQDNAATMSHFSPASLSKIAEGPMDILPSNYPELPTTTAQQAHDMASLFWPSPPDPLPEVANKPNNNNNITLPHPTKEVPSQMASSNNTTTMAQAAAPTGVRKRGGAKKTAGKQAADKATTPKRMVSRFSCQQCRDVKVRCNKPDGAHGCDRCTARGVQCVASNTDKRTNSTAIEKLNDLIDKYTKVARELTVRMLCYGYSATARDLHALPSNARHNYILKNYAAHPPATRGLLRAFGDLEALRTVPSDSNRKKPTLNATRDHFDVADGLCQRFTIALLHICNQLHSGEPVELQLILKQLQHGGLIHKGPVTAEERDYFKQQFQAEWWADAPAPIWSPAYHAGQGPTEHDVAQFEAAQAQSLPRSPASDCSSL